ncbi:hypothetical protein BDI4_720049 [Burkholderia diffusa]|nr:hypothetical protein BDI4_720049 [Burkholderia diffusa]
MSTDFRAIVWIGEKKGAPGSSRLNRLTGRCRREDYCRKGSGEFPECAFTFVAGEIILDDILSCGLPPRLQDAIATIAGWPGGPCASRNADTQWRVRHLWVKSLVSRLFMLP